MRPTRRRDVTKKKELSPQKEFARSLRALAKFYEEHPEFRVPADVRVYLFPEKEELAAITRALAPCEKQSLGGNWFILQRRFGKKLYIEANWTRSDVCERVVVGTKEIVEKVPVSFETQTKTVEVVEWRCPQTLLGREVASD
jgi:hypothetical protein